jgi:hypothetical protein
MGKEYQVRNGVLVDKTPRVAAIIGRNVGELVHSIVPLVDANLHLLDGTQLQDDGIYADGIAKIKALQTNYPNLFTTEADWQDSVTNYGICGKFVIGTGTLRLPKLAKSFIEATIDATALGDLVEAGLPNITGTRTGLLATNWGVGNGVFTGSQSSTGLQIGSSGSVFGTNGTAAFSAANSNAIYGNSDTVQPQSIKGFIYIVLGTFPKSSAVVNMDNIATDLNSKTTAEQAAHAAMPSTTKVDLTLPTATGQLYTMPADGYLTFRARADAAGATVYVRDTALGDMYLAISTAYGTNQNIFVTIAVSIGSEIEVRYTSSTPLSLVFRYCNGNAHLAS